MTTYLLNPVVFVGAYLACMIPTYVLPYFGSNSVAARLAASVVAAAAGASSQPFFVPFYLHLFCLVALCVLTYLRGKIVDKMWLLVFPFLALVFDLMPVLTWIPLVPTVMHLLAIVLGAVGVRAVSTQPAIATSSGFENA